MGDLSSYKKKVVISVFLLIFIMLFSILVLATAVECPNDEDCDGVPDYRDECLGTPITESGAVDFEGCSCSQRIDRGDINCGPDEVCYIDTRGEHSIATCILKSDLDKMAIGDPEIDYGVYGTEGFLGGAPTQKVNWIIKGLEDPNTDTSIEFGVPGDIPVQEDYTGDRKTDIGIFRPSSGLWDIREVDTGLNIFSEKFYIIHFGTQEDIEVYADYDGSGHPNPAIFRPSTGLWAIRDWEGECPPNFAAGSGGECRAYYGREGDIPVPADYDGDGKADIAIFRPSSGMWAIRDYNGEDKRQYYGTEGDIPVPADYNGNGRAEIAIFRPSIGLWAIYDLDQGKEYKRQYYGTQGDIPVPADYDGDGKADIAIFRPSSGLWAIRDYNGEDKRQYYGTQGDTPIPADYDGDGKANIAIFRPSNALWAIRDFNFTGPITITARGTPHSGVWPKMEVFVNGNKIGERDVNSNLKNYTFNWNGRIDSLMIRFGNDLHTEGGEDRNLFIDKIFIGTSPFVRELDINLGNQGTYYRDNGVINESHRGVMAWNGNLSFSNIDYRTYHGTQGDEPVPGDWNKDGKSNIAIFRPSTNLWAFRTGYVIFNESVRNLYYGREGDIPIPADYSGDNKSEIGMFRPLEDLWDIRSIANDYTQRFWYGTKGDIPVSADYSGDGNINPAIFRPSSGMWAIRDWDDCPYKAHGPDGGCRAYFGTEGDIPVPADYDGDGKADIAIFRPTTGLWAIKEYKDQDDPTPEFSDTWFFSNADTLNNQENLYILNPNEEAAEVKIELMNSSGFLNSLTLTVQSNSVQVVNLNNNLDNLNLLAGKITSDQLVIVERRSWVKSSSVRHITPATRKESTSWLFSNADTLNNLEKLYILNPDDEGPIIDCPIRVSCPPGFVLHDLDRLSPGGCELPSCRALDEQTNINCQMEIMCETGFIPYNTEILSPEGCPIFSCRSESEQAEVTIEFFDIVGRLGFSINGQVPGKSVASIKLDDTTLKRNLLGAKITSTKPIVVERKSTPREDNTSLKISPTLPEESTLWFFSNADTLNNIEDLLILNTKFNQPTLTIELFGVSGPVIPAFTEQLPAGGITTINLNEKAEDVEFLGAKITSTNPVIVERKSTLKEDNLNSKISPALPEESTSWFFSNADTMNNIEDLLILNPGMEKVELTINLKGSSSDIGIIRKSISGKRMIKVNLNDYVTSNILGAEIISDNPIIIERKSSNHNDIESYRISSAIPLNPSDFEKLSRGKRLYFGEYGDIPVPADYSGDGKSDIAIFRPSTGLWAIRGWDDCPHKAHGPDGGCRAYFGTEGYNIPVPADYNADGIANLALFRCQGTGCYEYPYPELRVCSEGETKVENSQCYGCSNNEWVAVSCSFCCGTKACVGSGCQESDPGLIYIISPENKTYNVSNILVDIIAEGGEIEYNWNGTAKRYITQEYVTFPETQITLNAYLLDSNTGERLVHKRATFTINKSSTDPGPPEPPEPPGPPPVFTPTCEYINKEGPDYKVKGYVRGYDCEGKPYIDGDSCVDDTLHEVTCPLEPLNITHICGKRFVYDIARGTCRALTGGLENYCQDGRCVECKNNNHCSLEKPFCHNYECVECLTNTNCEGDNPFCHNNNCVECINNDHCTGENMGCINNSCEISCDEDSFECPDETLVYRNPELNCEFDPCPEP